MEAILKLKNESVGGRAEVTSVKIKTNVGQPGGEG